MFERFSKPARTAVVEAQAEAVRASAPSIGSEHLLLALLESSGTVTAELLARQGFRRDELVDDFRAVRRRGGLSEGDAAALRELGIDVDSVVANVEQRHGEYALAGRRTTKRRRLVPRGHVAFEDEVKRVLEGALREAHELGDMYIGDEHLLLGLLRRSASVGDVLAAKGLDYAQARTAIMGARNV